MNKLQALNYLNELELHGYVFGLERINLFLQLLGNPEKTFKSIHVAGTNGKGSTCAFIAAILQKAGYKTGLYTSPHLIEFNERIRINGKKIKNNDLIKLIERLKKIKETAENEKNQNPKNEFAELKNLTYFEFTTALAFQYFSEKNIDFLVCETGMGGRLDATNVLNPMVSVITNVSMEHEQYLGNTLEKIAMEKAGIIKENIPAITAEQKKAVLDVFEKISKEKNSKLWILGKNFTKKKLKISLNGGFQQENANLAIKAIEELQKKRIKISDKAITNGLLETKWIGRFQIIQKNPFVVLDVGHNPACMTALKQAFVEKFGSRKAILVIGISSDKNIEKMAEIILPIAKKVIACSAKNRGIEAKILKKEFENILRKKLKKNGNALQKLEKKGLEKTGKNAVELIEIGAVGKAVKKAVSEAEKEDIVLITGSCFVVGEALKALAN